MTAQALHDMAAEAESEIGRRGIKLSAGIAERCARAAFEQSQARGAA